MDRCREADVFGDNVTSPPHFFISSVRQGHRSATTSGLHLKKHHTDNASPKKLIFLKTHCPIGGRTGSLCAVYARWPLLGAFLHKPWTCSPSGPPPASLLAPKAFGAVTGDCINLLLPAPRGVARDACLSLGERIGPRGDG